MSENKLCVIIPGSTEDKDQNATSPNKQSRDEMRKQWEDKLLQNKKMERRNAIVPVK